MALYFKPWIWSIASYRKWFLLSLIPVIGFLAFSALIRDRACIRQNIAASDAAPIADSADPAAYRPMSSLLAHPEELFHDDFLLMQLSPLVQDVTRITAAEDFMATAKEYLGETMHLERVGPNQVSLFYHGRHLAAGHRLVDFFARQLVKKAQKGRVRYQRSTGAEAGTIMGEQAQLIGAPDISNERALWRQERLVTAASIFVVSFLLVLFVVLVCGWANPSLKSERQLVRYLNVPVLGSVPNLNSLPEVLRDTSPDV